MEPSADKPPVLPSPAGAGEGAALVLDHLRRALADWPKVTALRVAFSGGLDSSVLLHALVQLARCEKLPPVYAIHIAHGLQAQARDWPLHCQKFCAVLGVPLEVISVEVDTASASLERAAREARHGAFAERLKKGELLLLAQHQDDQAETLLLALLRGAGVAGLAAMPERWQRSGITWHRPLLHVAAADIRAWLQARGELWVQDPSNTDERYTRNRIRHQLIPVLQHNFAQFRTTFARSSRHCAEAAQLLQELAAVDLATVGCPPRIIALQQLGRARQSNVLRYWLRSQHDTTASTAQMDQLLMQIMACRTRGHRIHLKIGNGFVRRQDTVLHWTAL